MAMLKIKKGDTVRVIAGSEKGKEGKVMDIDRKNGRVMVEGINKITKHAKPSAGNPNGGRIEKEAFFDMSNVMLVYKGEATRVGFKVDENGKKVRVAKKTGAVID